MAAMTDFMENKFLDWFFRGQALGITGASAGAGSGPTALFLGLLTAAPTDSTAGTEVTGGSYARVSVSSSLANWAGTQSAGSTTASTGNTGTTSNNGSVAFPTASGSWGTVTHFGIYDATSAGNLLFYGALGASQVVNTGGTPSFAAGQLTVQADN